MQFKKSVFVFIFLSFILIGVLPAINFIGSKGRINKSDLFNTDIVEKYSNFIVYKLLNRSLVEQKVVAGKEGFLFLGNYQKQILHKTQGLYSFQDKSIDEWTNKLKSLQNWYESKGIKFAMIIAPNKSSIHDEKLPNWVRPTKKSFTDTVYEYSKQKNINLLDVRPILIEHKKNHNSTLYFKKDTHWNQLASSLVFKETVRYLNAKYNINIKVPEYTFGTKKTNRSDLAGLLKIQNMYENNESVPSIAFDKAIDVCVGKINKSDFTFNKCNTRKNPQFTIYKDSFYSKTNKSLNNLSLLMLGDSFATSNSQLYNSTFNQIWKFHHYHLRDENLFNFVEKHKPQIVIYQIVEREFFNPKLVSALPEIKDKLLYDLFKQPSNSKMNKHMVLNNGDLIVTKPDPRILLPKLQSITETVSLEIEIESPHETSFQLFYKDTNNKNYLEGNSYKKKIKKGINKIKLEIPSRYLLNQLRIDIVNKKGNYKLNQLKIKY